MNQKTKGIVHNAFYTRNERKESLNSLFGLSQSTDMDIYDYEFDEEGTLISIQKKEINK